MIILYDFISKASLRSSQYVQVHIIKHPPRNFGIDFNAIFPQIMFKIKCVATLYFLIFVCSTVKFVKLRFYEFCHSCFILEQLVRSIVYCLIDANIWRVKMYPELKLLIFKDFYHMLFLLM